MLLSGRTTNAFVCLISNSKDADASKPAVISEYADLIVMFSNRPSILSISKLPYFRSRSEFPAEVGDFVIGKVGYTADDH